MEDPQEMLPPPPVVLSSPGNRKRTAAEDSALDKAAAPQPKAAKQKQPKEQKPKENKAQQQQHKSGGGNAGGGSSSAAPLPPAPRAPPAGPPQPPPQDVLPPPKAPTPLKSISAACPLSTHEELSNLENSILRYMAKKRLEECSVAKLQLMIDALPGLSDSVKAALTPPPSEPASGLLSRCLEEICDNLSSAKMMLSDGQVYSTFS